MQFPFLLFSVSLLFLNFFSPFSCRGCAIRCCWFVHLCHTLCLLLWMQHFASCALPVAGLAGQTATAQNCKAPSQPWSSVPSRLRSVCEPKPIKKYVELAQEEEKAEQFGKVESVPLSNQKRKQMLGLYGWNHEDGRIL